MKYKEGVFSLDRWDLNETLRTGESLTAYMDKHMRICVDGAAERAYFVSVDQLIDSLGYGAPVAHQQKLKELYRFSNQKDGCGLDEAGNRVQFYEKKQIRKRSGGYRTLTIPCEKLKRVQEQLLRCEALWPGRSRYAVAYYKGATLKNATACHVGKDVVLKMDIRHFFDSITFETVQNKAFDKHLCSTSVSTLLAQLCCCEGRLPQGAPTSPAVSNQIMRGFDYLVGEYCAEHGISYTRYCDDMTFSGNFDTAPVIDFVERQLSQNGFRVNATKTQILRQNRRQIVTGVVVNQKQQVPAAYRRKIRQEMWYCERFGVREHLARTGLNKNFCGKTDADVQRAFLRNLLGRVSHVLSIDDDNHEMLRYRAWISAKLCDGDDNFLCW